MQNIASTQIHTLAGRIFGICFIITFLSYGIGSTIIDDIVTQPDFLKTLTQNNVSFVTAAILMAGIHTLMNIALPMAMMPIIKPHSKFLANGYFALAIAATIILVIGVVFLLLLLPLSEISQNATLDENLTSTISTLLKKAGFYAYQIGMGIWGIGGLLLVTVLYRAHLVPKLFGIWGIIGYIIFTAGTLFELYGYEYGLMANIPGGLFEVFLSIWLIFRGFNVPAKQS